MPLPLPPSLPAGIDPALQPVQAEPWLAGVDHDLRTLAGGVVRLAEQLLGTALDGTQLDLAQRIRSNGGALLGLLEDMRALEALSALSTGALAPARVDFDLRRAVEDAGEALAAEAEQLGVELVLVVPPEIPGGVRGDGARLRQLLGRLGAFALASAVGSDASVRVDARVEAEGRAGGEVTLRVEFLGESAGTVSTRMSVSYVPGRESTAGAGERRGGPRRDPFSAGLGGAGLGLALVKRLVDVLGGVLQSATDPEGRGVLWFEVAFERRGRSTTRGLVPRVDLGGKRVLLVDDSASTRAAVRTMLELLAVDLDVAASEAEALRAMRVAATRGAPYDVVLVDAALPLGGSGRVAGVAAAGRTRVVLLAYPGAAARAGDALVVTKPVRVAQLHTTLRTLLLPPAEERPAPARPSRSRAPLPSSPDTVHPPPHRSGAYQAVRREEGRTSVPTAGPQTGVPQTGMPQTGMPQTGMPQTGAPQTGMPQTGAPQTEASWAPPAPAEAVPRSPFLPGSDRRRTLGTGSAPPPPAGEQDVVSLVIDLVAARAPFLVARMRVALADGRMDDLGALGQELHDQASRLSLLRLVDPCARLMRQARAGTPEGAAAAVQAIEDEVARSRASVSAEIGRRRG
ncbi:ATP-binding response regulator [Chondromyces apiculatus]|uniref:ATP-binding response regulator n=1 Tax=Chondromyces apiculatus TaxID=51 RepID=UPI0012DF096A|nr:response regulator [Chondromyces apiculatus]